MAAVTVAAPDPDPVVVFIVSLLTATAVADHRIALTNRAPSRNDFGASGPIALEVVFPGGKWDKKYRVNGGLCLDATCQDLSPQRSPSPP